MEDADDHTYPRSRRLLSGQAPSSPSAASSKDANPATELLQDMIREKRAQTQRTKKILSGTPGHPKLATDPSQHTRKAKYGGTASEWSEWQACGSERDGIARDVRAYL